MKKSFVLLLIIFIACGQSEPDATEVYNETWDNFEYMEDWQQEAISCIVVKKIGYEDYPNPNRMDEFKEYFIDHAKIAGIPDDKSITEWTEEETQRWLQSIKDNPGKFIKDTPQEVKDRYKYRLLDHIRYIGSQPYANCINDTIYYDEFGSNFTDNEGPYLEQLEFLISDVLENTNVGFEELCMLSFSLEMAIENMTYKYKEYDETIWCRENW
jgi:hypothetical protein